MTDEIVPILVTLLVVGVLAALIDAIFPARKPQSERPRPVAFAGLGFIVAFFGWGASWPVPNYTTFTMMLVGSVMFGNGVCKVIRMCAGTSR